MGMNPCGRYVALLRGVNVGGHNKLLMADLVSMFEDAGCSDVRSYIQSGNVVFTAKPAIARGIEKTIAGSISRQCGFSVPIVTRSADDLDQIVRSNPFLECDADERSLAVAFLAGKPPARGVKSLDPDRSPPDEFAVLGQEIYLCFPNGVARSRYTHAYFDSKLGMTSTVRNWKTTRKLLDLVMGQE